MLTWLATVHSVWDPTTIALQIKRLRRLCLNKTALWSDWTGERHNHGKIVFCNGENRRIEGEGEEKKSHDYSGKSRDKCLTQLDVTSETRHDLMLYHMLNLLWKGSSKLLLHLSSWKSGIQGVWEHTLFKSEQRCCTSEYQTHCCTWKHTHTHTHTHTYMSMQTKLHTVWVGGWELSEVLPQSSDASTMSSLFPLLRVLTFRLQSCLHT